MKIVAVWYESPNAERNKKYLIYVFVENVEKYLR